MKNIKMKNKLEGRQMQFPVLNPIEDFEYWNFSFKTENKEFTNVRFSLNKTFAVPVKSGVDFQFIDKDLNKIRESVVVSTGKVSFDSDICNVKIDENFCVNNGDHYEIYVKINGNGVHLKLFPIFPEWENGKDGLINTNIVGTKFLGWNFPVTHANIEGKVYINGKEIEINGTGNIEHSWGNDSIEKEFNYLFLGNCFLNDRVWIYFIGLLKDGTIGAKLINIDKDGVQHNYMKDFVQKDLIVKFNDITNQFDIAANLPKSIRIENKKKKIDLSIEIKEQIPVDIGNNNRLRAIKSCDFISEISLNYKDPNLKMIYKTNTISEFYSFI